MSASLETFAEGDSKTPYAVINLGLFRIYQQPHTFPPETFPEDLTNQVPKFAGVFLCIWRAE